MCHDSDSRPPELPADLLRVAGGAGAEILELTSADGTPFSTALAESPDPSGAGVVILPDVRGLHRFYIELAERLAEAGHHAIAIDYFGRTAGTGERGEDFDFWPHATATALETVQQDIAAATAALRERTGVERVATVGFCYGGAQSDFAATREDLGLDRVVAFYGGLDGSRFGMPNAREEIAEAKVPVLALFGDADQGIPAEMRAEFERNLEASGVEHEVVVYPGAPHSFFDRKCEEFAEACEDAWRRTLQFLS